MNKKYISTVIIATIISGLAWIGAYLLHKKTVNIKEELPALHTEVETLSIQASRLINLRKIVNTTSDDLLVLQSFFVAKDGALDFVKYIENMAISSGLVFRIDTVDELSDPALTRLNKSTLKMSIRVTGTLKRVTLFLSLIESLPYNIKIQRADLRKSGDDWTLVIDIAVVKDIEKTN